MTPLVLSLALTSPAQPVYSPPVQLAPGVRLQPQVSTIPVYRPPVVFVPVPVYPTYPNYPTPRFPNQPFAPQAVTLSEFSRYFTPTPGAHSVWIVHPNTRQAVQVNFVLPTGKLRDLEVDRNSIRFEFRNGTVEINFRTNGTVRVNYDN